MFLKRIELFGFKSFADKAAIHFSDELSVIVGPNGCGKSNVVDAIRWVLGAQSPKGLRTDKLTSVIFNGSKTRPALNVAQVTLVISNEQNLLPLEFSEVAIRRRVYRNGTSEYFINDAQVTLRDLRNAFYGTGIMVSEYIVLEQGKIDQVLTAKPEERRKILETAAGISKYRIKNQESIQRVQKVEANISQLEFLRKEVSGRYEQLKTQSKKALRYKELKQKIFDCQVAVSCKKYNELLLKRKSIEKEEEKQLAIQEQSLSNLRNLEGNNKEIDEIVRKHENKVHQHQRSILEIQTEKRVLKDYIRTLEGNIEEHRQQLSNSAQQIQTQKNRLEEILRQEAGINNEKKEAAQTKNKLLKQLQELEKQTGRIKEKMEMLQKKKNERIKLEALNNEKLSQQQKQLRNVVDILAEELDKHVRVEGNTFAMQKKAESELRLQLQRVSRNLDALYARFTDAALAGQGPDSKSIHVEVEKLLQLSHSSIKLFNSFCGMVPDFLHDFVKENGVLARKHSIDAKINTLIETIAGIADDIRSINDALVNLDAELADIRDLLHKHRVHLESCNQSQKFIQEQLQRYENDIKQLGNLIDTVTRQGEKTKQFLSQQEDEKRHKVNKLEEIRKREQEASEAIEALQTEIDSQSSTLQKFMDTISRMEEKIDKNKEVQYQLKQRKDAVAVRMQVMEENFYSAHGKHLETFLQSESAATKKDSTKLREKIEKYQTEIRELGAVNLLATEEFNQIEERHNFLEQQAHDLYTAKDNLQQVLIDIEKESLKKIKEAYNEVRKQFKRLFAKIMGGGSADIYFTDEGDMLNSGLEILAQPNNKKTLYLSQLSGGERAMVAVIFIFALYSYKPAPFCILDEIDAPLDDSNIDRFIALLQNFKHKSQFLVVSHNKRTIVHAKNIVGISMEETGVSTLVQMKVRQ